MALTVGLTVGLAIATSLGWSTAGQIALAVGLAYLFGFALTSIPLAKAGLALGAIAAAFLPRTEKEKQLLGPVGAKVTSRARTAVQAAREAGQNKLGELGINKEAIGGAVKNLATSAAGAAKQAAAGGGSSGGSMGGSGATGASGSSGTGTGGSSASLAGTTESSTSTAVL